MDIFGCNRRQVVNGCGRVSFNPEHAAVGVDRTERSRGWQKAKAVGGELVAQLGHHWPTRKQTQVHGKKVMSKPRRSDFPRSNCTPGDRTGLEDDYFFSGNSQQGGSTEAINPRSDYDHFHRLCHG